MNSNRNNNRRRGRGGNRGPGGGGHQSNRIDSRARGNAPQLLEKYRKLAHDASLNDDRVQTEYYLQFADHYFRVIADGRAQKDEHRGRRDGDRDQSSDYDDADMDGEEPYGERRPQSGRERDRDDDVDGDSQFEERDEEAPGGEGDEENNPFIRDSRRRSPRSRAGADTDGESSGRDGVDPGVLPPSLTRSDEADEPRRAPRARTRRPRPAEDGDGEALEAVN